MAETHTGKRPGWREDWALSGLAEHKYFAGLDPNKAVVERLSRDPVPENGRALDIGSGSGRHAIWLAERGWQVTGIDPSENQVQHCRERAEAVGLDIDFEVASVENWVPRTVGPEGGAFDLILVAFLHLPRTYRRVAEWLKPGGRLLIVLHAPDSPIGPSDPRLRPSLTEVVDSINPPLSLLHAERRKTHEGDIQLIVHAERPLAKPTRLSI